YAEAHAIGNPPANLNTLNLTLIDCIFDGNTTQFFGAIGLSGQGNFLSTITNCIFRNNTEDIDISAGAISFGGFAFFKSTITNCLFENNDTRHAYWQIADLDQNTHFINCTFTGATTQVARLSSNLANTLDFTNCIFWDNNNDITDDDAKVNIVNSIVEEASFVTGGSGNIFIDPLFTDSGNGDFTLESTSPARDVGDKTANTTMTDLGGNPRIDNTMIDMGAYEVVFIPSINIALQGSTAVDENSGAGLIFRFTRTGLTTEDITINYSIGVGGTAANSDFNVTTNGNTTYVSGTMKGTIKIPVGSTFADLAITPINDIVIEANEKIVVKIESATP
ncbi:MAG: choice-of-anchor Q domain-containing protein, partial [Chitinophagales bacterium]